MIILSFSIYEKENIAAVKQEPLPADVYEEAKRWLDRADVAPVPTGCFRSDQLWRRVNPLQGAKQRSTPSGKLS